MAPNRTSEGGYAGAIAINLAVAFLMVLMWAVISLNGNAEQESINRGGIAVVSATALIYVAVAGWLIRHPISAGKHWFIRRGGMCLMLATMLLYILAMSLWNGRVV